MIVTYLKKTDLETSIRNTVLEMILDGATDELDVFGLAADEAESLVGDYLTRYDMKSELEKTGDTRHKSIVFHMKNVCLYILYERVDDDDVPARVIKNYNDTIETLQEISRDKLTIGLQRRKEDTDGDGEVDTVVTKFRSGGPGPRTY